MNIHVGTRIAWRTEPNRLLRQHERLSRAVWEIAELALRGDNAGIAAQLRQIFQDLKIHFTEEEAMMAQYNYPGRRLHAKLHREILADLLVTSTLYEQQDLASVSDRLILHLENQLAAELAEDEDLFAFVTQRETAA